MHQRDLKRINWTESYADDGMCKICRLNYCLRLWRQEEGAVNIKYVECLCEECDQSVGINTSTHNHKNQPQNLILSQYHYTYIKRKLCQQIKENFYFYYSVTGTNHYHSLSFCALPPNLNNSMGHEEQMITAHY